MRILLREYLAMLKESGEFDALVPDLLRQMGIVPLSTPQIGIRQAGVDIAAVGKGGAGIKTLWLFVLKHGDIGRRQWDSDSRSVLQSLDEIKYVYLRNNVSPEHTELPVRIVVATTGDFKPEIDQNWSGYADRNTLPGRTYEFWNGDEVAALMDQHLLDEYALPEAARSQLRRALALIGEPDYDLQHYYAILKDLLAWDAQKVEKPAKRMRLRVRSLATASLALGILWHWAQQENNLRSAVNAAERTLLWAWDAIRKHGLTKQKKLMRVYYRLVETYLNVSTVYYNKVQSHLFEKNALARYYGESSLLNERVFEELGRIATIGLTHLFFGYATGNGERGEQGANVIGQALEAFIESHPMTGSPCYDAHCIDISLAVVLFCFTNRVEAAKNWLGELIGRLTYAYRVGKWFPISTDNFDDLVALEIDRENVDLEKLKSMSWMIPTVAQWAAALGADEAYAHLVGLREDALRQTCFQLWYPDETTDALRYGGPAHLEGGITEAPIALPATAEEMREDMKRLRTESPIKDQVMTSAVEARLPFLDFIGCRHFRTPVDPAFWQKLIAMTAGTSPPSVVAPVGGTMLGDALGPAASSEPTGAL